MPTHLLKCPNMTQETKIVAFGEAKLECQFVPTPSILFENITVTDVLVLTLSLSLLVKSVHYTIFFSKNLLSY